MVEGPVGYCWVSKSFPGLSQPKNPDIENGPGGKKHVENTMDPDKQKAESTPYRRDAFGNEEHAEVKYKTLKWQCGLLMVAETISLGILSIPKAVAGLGLVPAIVILFSMGAVASYTGYVIGHMADAGEVLMGRFGREVLFIGQMLFLIFLMASHILTFTVAMNTLTKHATCSLVFTVVGLTVSLLLSLPRTMKNMSWLSLAYKCSVKATTETSLITGFKSALNIILSYASHNAFFNVIAELKEARDFPKALTLLQCIDISLYLVTGVVIYYFAGVDVKSPALGSISPLTSKIAYGVIIAGVVTGHIACKSVYSRIFAGTDCMHKRDFVAVGSWIGLPGAFWLFMNKGLWFYSPKKIFLTCLNVFCFIIDLHGLTSIGLYASGKAIHDNPSSASFSCANNA
ncbi:hypothetical protein BDW59DRAFT_171353 [Aspergillus cavernicola]|uniref:Amino acid transporter transmembrane domain-containing protein n=1 Tax=Aspergillus cavernicola TaxID=176166 RepID=A0ABR4IHS8_9EURO